MKNNTARAIIVIHSIGLKMPKSSDVYIIVPSSDDHILGDCKSLYPTLGR